MINTLVSWQNNYTEKPQSIQLMQWVHMCRNGTKDPAIVEMVEKYRETGDSILKKSLPLVTVGALLTGHRDPNYKGTRKGWRRSNQIRIKTGWIALDVDGKDNPQIPDAEMLRDEIAKIVYVAFSGLSTGGKGVWALIKIANPERQAEYFQQLKKDFASRSILLDSTKGENPHDARFYSYDPGAIIKKEYKVYDRLPVIKKRQSNVNQNFEASSQYGTAAIRNEIEIFSKVVQGNRNNQLFKSSAALGSLVAGGVLNELDVRQMLQQTALSIGLKHQEIMATLESGLQTGFQKPRTQDKN